MNKAVLLLALSILIPSLVISGYSQSTTVNFAYTGSAQTWTVPPCVTSITVDVRGARGGGSNAGNGSRVTATLAVTPGQVLQINVGGMGTCPTGGWNGGGNGGAPGASVGCGGGGGSDIRVAPYALGNRMVVAAGGGGTGGGNTAGLGGAGGCAAGSNGASPFGQGGGGGTLASGGTAGPPWIASGNPGQVGSLGAGGNGGSDPCYNLGPGGGGGGGYYGGGGGGSDCFSSGSLGGGGGGGGSCLTPAGGTCTANFNAGNGTVAITYTNSAPVITCTNTGPFCSGATIQLNSSGGVDYDWTGPGGYNMPNTQNPTIPSSTTANAGVYTVTITSALGCSATGTTTVVVNPTPSPTASNTGPYCENSSVQLNSSGGTGYQWTGPNGFVSATQNPVITPAIPANSGTYTVVVSDVASGCSASTTTDVTVYPLPVPYANNTGPYCEGATIDFTSSGGADYDWTGPGGYVLNNTQNTSVPGALPIMSGTYTVTVTDSNNCVASATTVLLVNPLPIATSSNTGPYCAGTTIQLNAGGGAMYDWAGPAGFISAVQNPTINPSSSANGGTYTVTVTSAAGCVSTSSTQVIINDLPVPTATNGGPYCNGQTVELFGTGGVTYDWAGPNGFASNLQNPTITIASTAYTGIYTVTATDNLGCVGTATQTVTVYESPSAVPLFTPQNPTTLSPEVSFQDQSYSNIISTLWYIDGQVFNTPTFDYSFTDDGEYAGMLVVTNQWGCMDSTEFLITVTEDVAVFVPNSFTPNDDGVNEIFYIHGANWKQMEFIVFDRWGREVFYSDDQSKGWNGRRNNTGEVLMQGTYAYKLNIVDTYGKVYNLMGHINLIR